MGKVKRSQVGAAMSRPAAASDPIGRTKPAGKEAEKTVQILRGLESLDVNERLAACSAVAGLFDGGSAEEQASTVSRLLDSGGAKAILKRVLDADMRVRLHALGSLRNMCVVGGDAAVRRIVAADVITVTLPAITAACTAGADLVAGGGAAAAAAASTAAGATSADGAAGAAAVPAAISGASTIASQVSVYAGIVCEALALLCLCCEVVEEAVSAMVPVGCVPLFTILSTQPMPPLDAAGAVAGTDGPAPPAAYPRVRVAAARLLHVLSEHNDGLGALIRDSDTAKALLGRLVAARGDASASDGPAEHPLVCLHAAGTLANVYLQPVVVAKGGKGKAAPAAAAASPSFSVPAAEAQGALDAVLPLLHACIASSWGAAAVPSSSTAGAATSSSPLSALGQVCAALDAGRAAYMALKDSAGPAEAAQAEVDAAAAAARQARVRAKIAAGKLHAGTAAAGGGGGGGDDDGDDDAGGDDASTIPLPPALRLHKANVVAARDARCAFQSARRGWFTNEVRAPLLALEIAANLAAGADVVVAAGGAKGRAGDDDDDDVEEEEEEDGSGDEEEEEASGAAAAAVDVPMLGAKGVQTLVAGGLLASGLVNAIGSAVANAVTVAHEAFQVAAADAAAGATTLTPEQRSAVAMLPTRTRRCVALSAIAIADRAGAAMANVCAAIDKRVAAAAAKGVADAASTAAAGAAPVLWAGLGSVLGTLTAPQPVADAAAGAAAADAGDDDISGTVSPGAPGSLWLHGVVYPAADAATAAAAGALYASIDASLDEPGGNEEEEDEEEITGGGAGDDTDGVVSLVPRLSRLQQSLRALNEPIGTGGGVATGSLYGDEGIADLAFSAATGIAAAGDSAGAAVGGAGVGGSSSGGGSVSMTASQLANVALTCPAGIPAALRVVVVPHVLLGLLHAAAACKVLAAATSTSSFAPSSADLTAISHVANEGGFEPVAAAGAAAGAAAAAHAGGMTAASATIATLRAHSGMRSLDADARLHAIRLLGALGAPSSPDGRGVFLVDAPTHAGIGVVLATLLSRERGLLLAIAAADALMDVYIDEAHDDDFGKNGLLAAVRSAATALAGRVRVAQASAKASPGRVFVDERGSIMDRAALAHAKEVRGNLARFADYKASMLKA